MIYFDKGSLCPFCGYVAANLREEVAHMEAEHPGVIDKRKEEAGFEKQPDGSWVDRLVGQQET